MIKGGPIATTTAFRCSRGENLPTREMLDLYRSICGQLYTTNGESNAVNKKQIKEFEGVKGVEVIDEILEEEGVIVCRWHTPEEGWKVNCYGAARLVDDEFMKTYHVG